MRFLLPIAAILATTQAVAVKPDLIVEARAPSFSFEQWARDIAANPDGQHLSPAEALAAGHVAATADNSLELDPRSLEKRARCHPTSRPAKAPDAVTCIQYLASIGSRACTVTANQFTQIFRRCGSATISATKAGDQGGIAKTDSCANAAITCGKIMDQCFRADNTVAGSQMTVNGAYQININ
ncbi:hypothetical protein FBEOM_3191 [Fusarium beomiforme]|uniref:Uncharacterized protein n=1 Tax=Fusarium beomiforme TaxID=44412 RepID=A0A9P5AQ19_9HYPO|nr:hypothetical protein FBEOM_3191 [Fusarium beomiforme]